MIELIQICSPNVHLPVAQAIIKTESNFNQFAIGVNAKGRAIKQPTSYQEAVNTAKRLISQGLNIDMGYTQINSANLKWLGLSVEQVFDPCNNLKAMQTVYLTCYDRAGITGLGTRMQRAFSCYNTGNFTKGFKNGYVNKATKYFNEFVARAEQGQITYQQYPNLQTGYPNQYQQNNAYTHAQGLPQVNPVGEYQQALQVAQNTLKTQNTGRLTQVGQEQVQNSPTPTIEVQYHNWDIFGDYGFTN